MRKAASAADFRSYDSNGVSTNGAGGLTRSSSKSTRMNLGVLTSFYTSNAGGVLKFPTVGSSNSLGSGSANASSNAIDQQLQQQPETSAAHNTDFIPSLLPESAQLPTVFAPTSIRSSSSSSSIHSHSIPSAPSSSSLRQSQNGVVPPLNPQFSLASFTKYDGQPRKRKQEIAMVTEKLRDMQYEIGRLSRKIKEYEEESEQWSLRYSRRIVILSNISLGCWIFLLEFLDGLRSRSVKDTPLTRLFIPRNILAQAASVKAAQNQLGKLAAALANNTPLSAVLISSFLTGIQSSAIFILSAMLQIRAQSWKRNTGFLLSTCYSLYLVILRRREFRPHFTNYFNILANLVYVAARYYFLHGLLVFNSMRIL